MGFAERYRTKSLSLVLVTSLLTGVAVVASPVPAQGSSGSSVVFEGSGWGHGVGLSQWGARGMAVLGSSHGQILGHYYQGATIAPAPSPSPIWVNLERNFTVKTLTVGDTGLPGSGGPVQITSPAGTTPAQSGASIAISHTGGAACSVGVTNPGGVEVVINDPSCTFDFSWYDWSTVGTSPTTKLSIDGCTQPDWNVSEPADRPCQYARGTLHLRSGEDPASGPPSWALDLSAEMLYDDYVSGTSEMPYGWPTDALKAQAIASRSYGVAMQKARGAPASNSCDGWCHVKDSTSDQRYVGWGHGANAPWLSAVATTANQVLTHASAPNGVVEAFFSSSSGGATENVEERFTGGAKPYLVSVDDSVATDGTVVNPMGSSWTKSVSVATIKSKLGFEELYKVSVKTRRTSGSAWVVEYIGRIAGSVVAVEKSGTWTRTELGLNSEYIDVDYSANPAADEMFFYHDDGAFVFQKMNSDGTTLETILEGSGYTAGWTAITSIDLNGDGQDEMFFYRADGLFRFYDVNSDGSLGSPILAGSGYTTGWDSITAIDLDGDRQDEMFFYREDGLFRFYDIKTNGSLPSPMLAGSGYTTGWDSITAVDLDGDSQDEMFFYREDGLFRYYNVGSNGTLPSPLLAGSGYTSGWHSILAVDLDGDSQDEMFFYRGDGEFRYYNVNASGNVGSPILSGSNYETGWDSITAIQLD